MPIQKITPFLWFDQQAEEESQRVMKALMTMKKLDIRALQQAFDDSN